MPQMFPLNWLTLFIYFFFIFLFFNILSYYYHTPKNFNKKIFTEKIYFKLNWKW